MLCLQQYVESDVRYRHFIQKFANINFFCFKINPHSGIEKYSLWSVQCIFQIDLPNEYNEVNFSSTTGGYRSVFTARRVRIAQTMPSDTHRYSV